ncbi:MAG: DUF368 domain-containing protein [Candidatus Omnitrophota bacterium]
MPPKNIRSGLLKIYISGFCMGVADIIPGVSGGTIAFIFGIYERLVSSLRAIDKVFLECLFKKRWKEAWHHIDATFLLSVFAGIFSAIFILAGLLKWLLRVYPVPVHSFFFGLVAATVFIIFFSLRTRDFAKLSLAVIGAFGMYQLAGMIPVQTPDNLFFLFFSGVLAICAMILPGISGAFILLLLGKYEYVLEAIHQYDVIALGVLALGCVIGLLSFVRLLAWLLRQYHDVTLSILSGVVLGSLRKIWPWKESIGFITTPRGKIIPTEELNVLPQQMDSSVVMAVVLMIMGFALSFILSRFRTADQTSASRS